MVIKRKKVTAKKTVKKVTKKVKSLRCASKTKDGKRCKNSATGKSKCCAVHKRKKAA